MTSCQAALMATVRTLASARSSCFAGAVVLHLILISAQVSTTAGIPFIQVATFGVFSEVQRGTMTGVRQRARVVDRLRRPARRAGGERSAQARAADAAGPLQEERAQAQRDRQPAPAARAAPARRRSRRSPPRSSPAGASPEFRDMTIDKGIVGRRCSRTWPSSRRPASSAASSCRAPRAAKVQMLIDRNAAAGALIERTRAQGVVVGQGDAAADGLRARHGRRQAGRSRRHVGHRRDLSERLRHRHGRIGRRGPGHLSTRSRVRPAVDFSRLEEVLVVTTPPAITAPDCAEASDCRGAPRQARDRPRMPRRPCPGATPQNETPRYAPRGLGREGRRVLAIAVALALQTTLASLVIRGTAALDLVLIVVVYLVADLRPGHGAAARERGRAGSGRPVERHHRHRRAGEDGRRLCRRASSGPSSS